MENGCEMHVKLEILDPLRDSLATDSQPTVVDITAAANMWERSCEEECFDKQSICHFTPILWNKNCWGQMPEIRNMHFDLFLMTLFVE